MIQHFPARLAELGFSMEVPEGFAQPPMPEVELNFDEPTFSAPLALIASQFAAAFIAVAARPAYSDGAISQWFGYLANHFGMQVSGQAAATVGSKNHPALVADCAMVQDGTTMRIIVAALEDGGRFVTVQGICPEELWPSYGEALRNAVLSFTLDNPRGSTVPLMPPA